MCSDCPGPCQRLVESNQTWGAMVHRRRGVPERSVSGRVHCSPLSMSPSLVPLPCTESTASRQVRALQEGARQGSGLTHLWNHQLLLWLWSVCHSQPLNLLTLARSTRRWCVFVRLQSTSGPVSSHEACRDGRGGSEAEWHTIVCWRQIR